MKAKPFDVFGCIWGMLMSLVAVPYDTWKTLENIGNLFLLKFESDPDFFLLVRLTDDLTMLCCQARELFATCVALPIAWLHLDADVEGSRRRKHERVKEGP